MNRRRESVLVGLLLAVAWAVWLQRFGVNDHDDMLSNELLFARNGLGTLLFHIPWADQSPLYFLFLRVVRLFGTTPAAVQAANGLLLTVSLVATYVLAFEFSGSVAVARGALLLGVLSPTTLWLVRMGRMYSLQVCLAALTALAVLRYLRGHRASTLAAIVALSLANIYTHFFGFLICGLLLLPLLADVWATRATRPDAPGPRPAPDAVIVACLTIALLSIPQMVRLWHLVGSGGPGTGVNSLPGFGTDFLRRVGWFWFVNADWGTLRRGEQMLTLTYLGSVVLLAVAGLVAAGRRVGAAAAVWIVVPLVAIGLVAARMDVRDRYFAWALPVVWMVVATGGLAPLPERWVKGGWADVARGTRAALVLAVALGSGWLLWNKLPERYAEWTRLMDGVQQVYEPSMVVYMPPSSASGSPTLLVSERDVPEGLRSILPLTPDTHARFLSEVDQGRDFVFLVYGALENDELHGRQRLLQERQYQRAVLTSFAVRAELYTRQPSTRFTTPERIPLGGTIAAVADWAHARLASDGAAQSGPALSRALVARVDADGTARVGRVFMSQRGEAPAWRLGPQDWDVVEATRATSGGQAADVVSAHPANQSTLVVGYRQVPMARSLDLLYGIRDSGLGFREGASVEVRAYVNGQLAGEVSCPNTAGWKHRFFDTAALDGRTADVVLLITTANDAARHFAVSLTPSRAAAAPPPPTSPSQTTDAGAIDLRSGLTLSDRVEQLRVSRIEGAQVTPGHADGQTYSAADIHESHPDPLVGSMHRVWAFGPLLWDAVGSTRQASKGDVRKGIWAHPRDGSTLVIEAPQVLSGPLLRGFFGLTDWAVTQATGTGVREPLTFRIFLDGRPVVDQVQERVAGWTSLAIPAGTSTKPHHVRVEVSAPTDKWGHFVFDLSN